MNRRWMTLLLLCSLFALFLAPVAVLSQEEDPEEEEPAQARPNPFEHEMLLKGKANVVHTHRGGLGKGSQVMAEEEEAQTMPQPLHRGMLYPGFGSFSLAQRKDLAAGKTLKLRVRSAKGLAKHGLSVKKGAFVAVKMVNGQVTVSTMGAAPKSVALVGKNAAAMKKMNMNKGMMH
jgi:hypothetical protein